jgi:alginate O-acetyltransferase complex protein AlgI
MTFVSWQFLALFGMVLIGLRVMPTREARQALILLASIVFYGSGTAWHLLVLLAPALIDYACAIRIEDAAEPVARKRWLLLSLISNLGILAYFKYADFFVDNVASLLGVSAVPLGVALPVGISFFLFKTMSYTIDVYRRELTASRSLWRYAMFVSYFPELVAGPIVRASIFLPQLTRGLEPSMARAAEGGQRVLLGVTKKVLFADRLAVYVDAVFAAPHAYSQWTTIGAVVAYSLQIYCDFSGYSDMAIGTSRIIGFDLPENFNLPYAATSITDFWRRWHMTLSSWLRDYLYIPLGGNRLGSSRTYVNLMVTMLLGGLWHGANWTFMFWGALHGIGLAAHKAWDTVMPTTGKPGPLRAAVGWAATYALVCLAWVFFRARDFGTAAMVIRKMAGLEPGGVVWVYAPFLLILAVVAVAHIAWVAAERRGKAPLLSGAPARPFVGGLVVAAWLIGLFLLSPLRTSPFIYFRF